MKAALLVIAAALLAGCQAQVPAAQTGARPPEGGPVALDSLDEDPRGNGWAEGVWDPDVNLTHSPRWSPGEVRLTALPAGDRPPAVGLYRNLSLDEEGATAQVGVRAVTLHRFGLYFSSGDRWSGVEMSDDGFLVAGDAAEGWRVTPFEPAREGRGYVLRVSLFEGGRVLAVVYDDAMRPLASHVEDGLLLEPEDVRRVAVGVWTNDGASPRSDYVLTSLGVSKGGWSGIPPA